jgi:hypothetical protein
MTIFMGLNIYHRGNKNLNSDGQKFLQYQQLPEYNCGYPADVLWFTGFQRLLNHLALKYFDYEGNR